MPTQRDDDGLALSSRNIYLDEDERAKAVALPRALGVAARAIARGDDPVEAVATAHAALIAAGFAVDYVALADAETLAEDPARRSAAPICSPPRGWARPGSSTISRSRPPKNRVRAR